MATKKPKPPPDDPAQSQRFIQTARETSSEDGGAIFKRALDAIVPEKHAPRKRGRRSAASARRKPDI